MDWSALATMGALAATGAGTVMWWMFRRLQSEVDLNKDNLAAFKLYVAEHYPTNGELRDAIGAFNRSIDAVFNKLDRIEDKLDKKADKP